MECNTNNDVISVIVPIYNVERYLDQALYSIRNQTYADLEIICVNDGSTDGSLDIVKSHAANDFRIIIVDKPNGGYGSACNAGLDQATGAWIAIVEPDDWILPDMYFEMMAYRSQFLCPIDIIKTPYVRVSMPDTPQEHHYECSYKHRIRPSAQPFILAQAPHLIRHHPSIWSALYSRDFLLRQSIKFKEIPGAGWADNPFLMETMLAAKAIIYLDKAYYCYREDTPEKEAAFSQNSPTIPFERWLDMQDIIDRVQSSNEHRDAVAKLNLTDEVMRLHVEKAFIYYNGIARAGAESQPEAASFINQVWNRIDAKYVLNNATIAHSAKSAYCKARGIDETYIDDRKRKAYLISEGLYNLRNNGIGYTLSLMRKNA